jgi:hypothetical protein
MARIRSEHGRESARGFPTTVHKVPDDVEFRRLRELALDDAQEGEVISAALDAVARDYFKRAVLRAVSRRIR